MRFWPTLLSFTYSTYAASLQSTGHRIVSRINSGDLAGYRGLLSSMNNPVSTVQGGGNSVFVPFQPTPQDSRDNVADNRKQGSDESELIDKAKEAMEKRSSIDKKGWSWPVATYIRNNLTKTVSAVALLGLIVLAMQRDPNMVGSVTELANAVPGVLGNSVTEQSASKALQWLSGHVLNASTSLAGLASIGWAALQQSRSKAVFLKPLPESSRALWETNTSTSGASENSEISEEPMSVENPNHWAHSYVKDVYKTSYELAYSGSVIGVSSYEDLRRFLVTKLADMEEAEFVAGDLSFRMGRGSNNVQVFQSNSDPINWKTEVGLPTIQYNSVFLSYKLSCEFVKGDQVILDTIEKPDLSQSEMSNLGLELSQPRVFAVLTEKGVFALGSPTHDLLFQLAPDSIIRGTKIEGGNGAAEQVDIERSPKEQLAIVPEPGGLDRSVGNDVIDTVNQLHLSGSAIYDAAGVNSFDGLRSFMFSQLGNKDQVMFVTGDVSLRIVKGSTDVQVFLRDPLMQQFQNFPNTQLGLLTQADDQGISHMLKLSELIPKSRISKKVEIKKSNLLESELSQLLVDLKQQGISAASTLNGIYTLGGPNFDALYGFAPDSILGKIITQQGKGTKIEVVNESQLVISDSPTSSGATVAKLSFGETLVLVGSTGMDVAQDMKQFAKYNPTNYDATEAKTAGDLNVLVRELLGDNNALIVVTKNFYLLTEKTSNNVQVFERTEANNAWLQEVTNQQATPLAAGTDLAAKAAKVIVLTQTLGEDGISHVYAVSGFVPTPVGRIEIDTPLLSEVSIPKLQSRMEKIGASVAQTANGLILFGGPNTFYSIDTNSPLASYILMQRNSQMRIGSQNQLVISQTPTTSNPAVLKVFHNSQLVRIPDSVMGRIILPSTDSGIVHAKPSGQHVHSNASATTANGSEGWTSSKGMPYVKLPHGRVKAVVHSNASATA